MHDTIKARRSREWLDTQARRERDILHGPARPSGGPFDLQRPEWVRRAQEGRLQAVDRTWQR